MEQWQRPAFPSSLSLPFIVQVFCFGRAMLNSPELKQMLRFKKKKSRKEINKNPYFDGQLAGMEKVENAILRALPTVGIWCFTGRGGSTVQTGELCFLLFHTQTAFPSKKKC